MTGWFNIVGLIGIVYSVDYGAAIFLNTGLALSGVNIFADRVLALLNYISVGWHLLGVAVIIAVLIFVPDHHQSASFVFTHKINNNGAFGGSTTALGFWLFVLPVGFLLTMYTETGYDA